jgi:hypothetical protein
LRADHQPRRAAPLHRRQRRPRHEPRVIGGGSLRPRQSHQHRLALLPDPRHYRGPGEGSTSC